MAVSQITIILFRAGSRDGLVAGISPVFLTFLSDGRMIKLAYPYEQAPPSPSAGQHRLSLSRFCAKYRIVTSLRFALYEKLLIGPVKLLIALGGLPVHQRNLEVLRIQVR